MTWYTIGAAIIGFMLAVNFGVFLLRAKLSPGKASPISRKMAPSELAIYLAMVAVWIVGFALPYLWPDTQWGQVMGQTWALPSLVAWSMLVGVVLSTAMRLARRRSGR
jgi:hypothetical protein